MVVMHIVDEGPITPLGEEYMEYINRTGAPVEFELWFQRRFGYTVEAVKGYRGRIIAWDFTFPDDQTAVEFKLRWL